MFRVDPSITHIDATREQVVSIIESINHPAVGVPGHPPQVTQAYVVGRRSTRGTFSIFIYLYLTESRDAVVYRHEGELALEQFREMEADAITFAESMGFMVDNLNFRNLSVLQQEDVMERIPCFQQDLRGYAERQASEEIIQAPPGDEPEVLDLSESEIVLEDREPEAGPTTLGPEAARRIGRLLGSF